MLLSAGLAPGQAHAQPAPAEPELETPAQDADLERVSSIEVAALIRIDREELERSGANNMSDALRYLSINYGSDFNLDVPTTAAGTTQFNLRGLGLSGTLVLLNGRRLVQSGAVSVDGQNFVDLNSLPLQAIDSIELLKGGSSAIYGADAVAGVVNIVTRAQMDGLEAQAGAQTTDTFDQHEWDMSLLGGTRGEDTSATVMLSYFQREPLRADQRDFTHDNFVSSSYPSVFVPVAPANRPGMRDDSTCGAGSPGLPNSKPVPSNPSLCAFDIGSYFMLVPEERRLNLYATLSHDLDSHVTAALEAGYADARTRRSLSPTLPLLNPAIVPADHPGNRWRIPVVWQGRLNPYGLPPGQEEFDSRTWLTVAKLGLDLSGLLSLDQERKWEGSLTGTWSENQFDHRSDDTNLGALQDALRSCVPASADFNATECIDPFDSTQPLSSAQLRRLHVESIDRTRNRLLTLAMDVNGRIDTDLLPSGDFGVAAGLQFRRENTTARFVDNDGAFSAPPADWSGDIKDHWQHTREVFSAYTQLALGLLRGLELQADFRIEHYSDIDETALIPVLGFVWTPATTFSGPDAPAVRAVHIRGTYATSVLPPSLLQLYGVQRTPTQLLAPDADAQPSSEPANYGFNVTTGNRSLKASRSQAITVGVGWEPITALSLLLDYWHYHLEASVVRQDPRSVFDQLDATDNVKLAGQVVQQVHTSFQTHSVTTHGLDLGVEGRSDFGADHGTFQFAINASHVLGYEIPTDAVAPNSPCGGRDVAGCRNLGNFVRSIPNWRASLVLSWLKNEHAIFAIAHLVPGYTDDGTVPWDVKPPPRVDQIDAFFSLDLQYSLKLEYHTRMSTTFKVGVKNAFDSDPPAANGPLGYDTEIHDPRGRLAYLRLIQQF
jgi:iron complex outermembrane receptor protein